MDFERSCKYLLSLGNEVSAMKLGLKSVARLLSAIGDPQSNFYKVQVAGTNGKGSVCAFLSEICFQAGVKTGLFTSPHLISITERIKINGRPIDESDFASLASEIRGVAETLVASGELETVPTFFEQITALALAAFANANAELAILETGLGGRLDAATAANAEVIGIARIDLDHQTILGESIDEIAAEKAAIIKRNGQVVVGEQSPAALKVILDRCRQFGARPKLADRVQTTIQNGSIRFSTKQDQYPVTQLGLLGRHQVENAKVAILLAEILQNRFAITKESIIRGLESARHPGRLEFRGRYLFDGAHNPGGARALRSFLDERVNGPITMVFGAMNDKDVRGMAELLLPKADLVILTEPTNPRALSPNEMEFEFPGPGVQAQIIKTRTVEEALSNAERLSKPDAVILVTGSLYLVGEAQAILERRSQI